MGRLREKVDRLTKLLPDPQGVADGEVVTTQAYVDERGITQYGYVLTPGGGGGTGTVTSVDVSGGTTGLTTSGGPVTTAGVITLAGTLAIANGGTGQTTAPNAINALLPSQGGNSGKVLGTNGTVASWVAAGGTGTVTNFSAGNLSPLFNASVATSTTTPALTFAQITQSANLIFAGPASGGAANPTFRTLVAADIPAQSTQKAPGATFNTGDVLLSGTQEQEIYIPYSGTITGWTILGKQAGSVSIIVSNSTYAAYDTMSTLLTATCTTAIKNQATGLSIAVVAGALRFSGSGFSGFTRCSIVLTVQT